MILGASLFSRLGLGYLSDKADSWFLAFASTFSSCIIVFLLWGVASTTLGGLIAFGLIFGFCGCGWACLWTGLMRDLTSTSLLVPRGQSHLTHPSISICRGRSSTRHLHVRLSQLQPWNRQHRLHSYHHRIPTRPFPCEDHTRQSRIRRCGWAIPRSDHLYWIVFRCWLSCNSIRMGLWIRG